MKPQQKGSIKSGSNLKKPSSLNASQKVATKVEESESFKKALSSQEGDLSSSLTQEKTLEEHDDTASSATSDLKSSLSVLPVEEKKNPWKELQRGECPKISPRGQGLIVYALGYLGEDFMEKEDCILGVRILESGSLGTFSKEWIPLLSVQEHLQKTPSQIVKSSSLSPLFLKQSNNNTGYLMAILKYLKVIQTLEGILSHFIYQPQEMESLLNSLKSQSLKAHLEQEEVLKTEE